MDMQDHWQQVEELLNRALGLPALDRQRFLAAIQDDAVRAEVESLLAAAHSGFEQHLENAIGAAAEAVKAQDGPISGERMLGRFHLLHLLGIGGMSEVYLARDPALGRQIALKLLPPRFSADPDRVRRFKREARAASALNHPNILTIFEIGEENGQLFIVTEYVDGEVLRTSLARGAMSLAEVLDIGEQLASALTAAHAVGILHRDITPANIMLRRDRVVKLLDFGLARIELDEDGAGAAGRTMPGTIMGTPSYMSPEQARGRAVDGRSDLWSLGAVLYEALTGHPAFQGDSTPDILVSVLERQPSPPSDQNKAVPAELDSLVMKLLAKDPARRFSSAADLLQEFKRLREAPVLKPAGDKAAAPRSKPPARKRMLVPLSLCAAAGLAAWYSTTRLHPPKEPLLRQVTTKIAENRVTAAALSPDGSKLAYAEMGGPLVSRAIESDETTVLPSPRDRMIRHIAWMADGTRLVISVESNATSGHSIWLIPNRSGGPRLLQDNAKGAVASPDGSSIAFTSQNESEVWVKALSGGSARKIAAGSSTETFHALLWSPDGRRITYERRFFAPKPTIQATMRERVKDYQSSYESIELSTGRLLAEQQGSNITAACAVGNGRILLLRDEPERAHDFNIWEVRIDPSTGKFRSLPRRLTQWKDAFLVNLMCSADGKSVAVLRQISQSDIYIGDVHPGHPLSDVKRLTMESLSTYPHAWTADSKQVIFEIQGRTGWDIHTQELGSRTSKPLVAHHETEIMPQLSPDGRWVLYASYEEGHRAEQKLMRVPTGGGEPQVVPSGPFDEFRCALRADKRCVLRTIENRQYVYSELDTVKGRGRELTRTAFTGGILGNWSLSADGSEVAIPGGDGTEARIQIYPLNGEPAGMVEVLVAGLSRLRGLSPAAVSKDWFGSIDIRDGVGLVYIQRNGRFHRLHESPVTTWGVPSPDGRKLAFVDQTLLSNVWMVDGL